MMSNPQDAGTVARNSPDLVAAQSLIARPVFPFAIPDPLTQAVAEHPEPDDMVAIRENAGHRTFIKAVS